ncbi:histone-fold-containing protein [Globomyces pollinis-pini]|nr:histone-fold-containing protein [Globomyces pollinis-pini]
MELFLTLVPTPKKQKTRFPAARIKRIMRSDEDVGKVSQVTPVLIAKALECFLAALLKTTVEEIRQREAKKMTVSHL